MTFNSNTYHRNKARRAALEHLAEARDCKMKRCDDDLAALRAGRMTHAAFMERWGE